MAHAEQQALISVIIPVYQDQAGLEKCLRALAVQTYPSERMEVIVVDNGSRPAVDLPACATSFARLIQCYKPGSYAARNRGIVEASGEILAFTDADCIPEPQWLEKGVEAIVRNARNKPIGGEVVLFSARASPSAVERYQIITGFSQQDNVKQQAFSVTANLLVPTCLFKDIGFFDEHLFSGGDRDWGWRAHDKGHPIGYEPEVVVRHPCRPSLASMMRQARRVAGGRLRIGSNWEPSQNVGRLRPHRRPAESFEWLLRHPDIQGTSRFKVLAVAGVLWLSRVLETIRLLLGGTALR